MNGDVEGEAPRPRPLSAGIWSLFSWLRRADRSSSSESVSSVGSDRTVASFDFLAPLHYKQTSKPLVLPQDPLTDTYKQRLHERNLRKLNDRDITLRRKYGLFREEGLGYDAFSLPSAHKLQKDTVPRHGRERRAASEINRRSAYVPGKRRAPLPPTIITSITLPRNYKRKKPAPKPPVKISEENKENVEINRLIQMNPTTDVNSLLNNLTKEVTPVNKTENASKRETKEVKLRTDRGFLKQIFDSRKRSSAIDTSRIKLLPSISELDKQAAEIIAANKALQASGYRERRVTDESFKPGVSEETWMCTTCLRKYKPVVTCCIYCLIKESSNNRIGKNIPTHATNICTQTENNALNINRNSENNDKKKLREMLKEMKDSLPKRPKHNDKYSRENRDCKVKPTETPTLRIGSPVDKTIKDNDNIEKLEKEALKNNIKDIFFLAQPSCSRDITVKHDNIHLAHTTEQSNLESPLNLDISDIPFQNGMTSKVITHSAKNPDISNLLTPNNVKNHSVDKIRLIEDIIKDDLKVTSKTKTSVDLGNIKTDKTSQHDEKLIGDKKSKDQPNMDRAENKSVKEPKEIYVKHQLSIDKEEENFGNEKFSNISVKNNNLPTVIEIKNVVLGSNQTRREISSNIKNANLNTPLKISSLLNPLYCPKIKTSTNKVTNCNFAKNLNLPERTTKGTSHINITTTHATSMNVQTASTSNAKVINEALQKSATDSTEETKFKNNKDESTVKENLPRNIDKKFLAQIKSAPTPNVTVEDHHERRRKLIIQLEQAISKGDEQLAAEAAAKLAKLKLACSVLSFSSQIVAESALHKTEDLPDNESNEGNNKDYMKIDSMPNTKVDTMVQTEKVLNANKQQKNQYSKRITRNEMAIASTSSQILDDEVTIEIWVEDKIVVRGPIPLRISRKAKITDLKEQVETSLGLEIRLQRWIVGRILCIENNTPLADLAGPDLTAPFFLCLVESDTNISPQIKGDLNAQINAQPNVIKDAVSSEVYTELMKLEQQALVPNSEQFECGVCIEECAVGAGVVLRECIHTFCRECLSDMIRHCEEPQVPCPAIQCPGVLQEREIRAILSTEEYERWLARGLAAAERGTRNTFHCRTRDCKGWAFCEPGVCKFPCPVCKHTNCVPCQALHEGETCKEYRKKMREAVSAAESNQTDEGTQALLKSLISRGEALECPGCSAIITKKWGCDWVKCAACKTEICWVTKGRRWGPAGHGDSSGGCRCGVDGKRCHPSCQYCH